MNEILRLNQNIKIFFQQISLANYKLFYYLSKENNPTKLFETFIVLFELSQLMSIPLSLEV
jgi:hypothetical protein